MVVQHNLRAMNSNRMLGITQGTLSKSAEKLSSGYKINRAADDAAGLSISEKMRKQIRGLSQASLNAEDGISSVQTAEGALTEVHDMLQRMNELAVKAANGTNSESDRQSIQDEIKQLTTEIDRVSETTKFNETYLLKGGKDPVTKTLKSYDAGLKGTMSDDGGDSATFTTSLKVGESVDIAGKQYNIIAGADADGKKGNEEITNVQQAIKDVASGKTVTIEGTAYKASGLGASKTFEAGTGTTYTIDELVGKVSDGTTVKVDGYNGGKSVIARDYDKETNITADEAAKKIQTALIQANSIGATKSAAEVTYKTDVEEIQTIANGGKVETGTTQLYAFDSTTNELKKLAASTDITDLVNDPNIKIYKGIADGDNTGKSFALDGTGKTTEEIILVHKDAIAYGVEKVFAKGDAIPAGASTGFDAATSTNTATLATGYLALAEADLVADAIITNATHKASAKIDDDQNVAFKLNFKDPAAGVATDTETAEKIVAGQNMLLDNISSISYVITDANASGKFAHNFTGDAANLLDIDENGKVSYDGIEICNIEASKAAATTAGNVATLAITSGTRVDAESAKTEGSDTYTFDIKKGTTEVKQDLNLALHVGADADMTNKINVNIASMDSKGLGVANINVADDSGVAATYAVDAIEQAIKTVSAQRSALGAIQNRLEHTINNLDNVVENTTAAESQIRDTDMATEMVKYSNANILAQAGQSMLAQANQSNQGVLSILG